MSDHTKSEEKISENKTLFSNFTSLAIVQAANYILPLINFPYLTRVLGVEKLGYVYYAQALIFYLNIFTDYGFNYTSVRDLSVNANNREKVQRIINSTLSTKIILLCVSFVLLFSATMLIPKFREEQELLLLSFFMIAGQAFSPVWFFQGIQKMRYITYFSVSSKLLFTLLIFILIKQPGDYRYVNLMFATGDIIIDIVALYVIFIKFGYKFTFVINDFTTQLKNGWRYFAANISTCIYRNSNLVILGFWASPVIIGYYSIADKIFFALRQLVQTAFQSIYPHVCRLAGESHEKLKVFFKKVTVLVFLSFSSVGLLIFIFAEQIIYVISGIDLPVSVTILKLFAFVPLIIALNIPSQQVMLAYNLQKNYLKILFAGSVFNISLNLILAHQYSWKGTVTSVIVTELFITTGLALILNKKHPEKSIFKA